MPHGSKLMAHGQGGLARKTLYFSKILTSAWKTLAHATLSRRNPTLSFSNWLRHSQVSQNDDSARAQGLREWARSYTMFWTGNKVIAAGLGNSQPWIGVNYPMNDMAFHCMLWRSHFFQWPCHSSKIIFVKNNWSCSHMFWNILVILRGSKGPRSFESSENPKEKWNMSASLNSPF